MHVIALQLLYMSTNTHHQLYLSWIATSSSSMSKSLTTSDDAVGGSTTTANSSSRVPIIIIFAPGFTDSSLNFKSLAESLPNNSNKLTPQTYVIHSVKSRKQNQQMTTRDCNPRVNPWTELSKIWLKRWSLLHAKVCEDQSMFGDLEPKKNPKFKPTFHLLRPLHNCHQICSIFAVFVLNMCLKFDANTSLNDGFLSKNQGIPTFSVIPIHNLLTPILERKLKFLYTVSSMTWVK